MKRANEAEDLSSKRSAPAAYRRVCTEVRCVESKEALASWLQERSPRNATESVPLRASTRNVADDIDKLWQHGEPLEVLFLRGDSYVELLLAVSGRANEFVLTERDVTDRQQELNALTDFFENGSVALHWIGEDGRILRYIRAFSSSSSSSSSSYQTHSFDAPYF
jgi:hypothetical protein